MLYKYYNNAQDAFEEIYDFIIDKGIIVNDTKTIYNTCITLLNPLDNIIKTKWRKWNENYAKFEWDWYLSGDRNALEISKRAKIWESMMDENNNVNSNYGFQWSRSNQLNKVIEMLKTNPTTRRASISIYDGKEIDLYEKDTPCTYSINFYIDNEDKINMQVMMRSNDLVFGFCNDQYCFSNLLHYVSEKINKNVGTYFHYVCNMHIYERHYNLKIKNLKNEL